MDSENQEKRVLSQQELILRTISEQLASINNSTNSPKIDLSKELSQYSGKVTSDIYELEMKVYEFLNIVRKYTRDNTQNLNTIQKQINEFNLDHRNKTNDLIISIDKILISDKQKKYSAYAIIIMGVMIVALVSFSIYSGITIKSYEKKALKYEYMKYLGDKESQQYTEATDYIFLESKFSELKESINIKKDEIQKKLEAAELAKEKESQAQQLSNEAEQIRKQAEKKNK